MLADLASLLAAGLALAATAASALSLPLSPRQQQPAKDTSDGFAWPAGDLELGFYSPFNVTMDTAGLGTGRQTFGAVNYCRPVEVSAGDWARPGLPLNVSIDLVPCPIRNGTASCFRSAVLATDVDANATIPWFCDTYIDIGFAFVFEQQGRSLAQLVTTIPPKTDPGQCNKSRLKRTFMESSLSGTIKGTLESVNSAGLQSNGAPTVLLFLLLMTNIVVHL